MRGVLMRKYKRTRTTKGRYKADNKKTKFNEAWVKGKSPKNKNLLDRLLDWLFKGFYK